MTQLTQEDIQFLQAEDNAEVLEQVRKLRERKAIRLENDRLIQVSDSIKKTINQALDSVLTSDVLVGIPEGRTLKIELAITKAGFTLEHKGAPKVGGGTGGNGGAKVAVQFEDTQYESITECCDAETSGTKTDGQHTRHHCKPRINKAAKERGVKVTFQS
jgi:hypothetical protein